MSLVESSSYSVFKDVFERQATDAAAEQQLPAALVEFAKKVKRIPSSTETRGRSHIGAMREHAIEVLSVDDDHPPPRDTAAMVRECVHLDRKAWSKLQVDCQRVVGAFQKLCPDHSSSAFSTWLAERGLLGGHDFFAKLLNLYKTHSSIGVGNGGTLSDVDLPGATNDWTWMVSYMTGLLDRDLRGIAQFAQGWRERQAGLRKWAQDDKPSLKAAKQVRAELIRGRKLVAAVRAKVENGEDQTGELADLAAHLGKVRQWEVALRDSGSDRDQPLLWHSVHDHVEAIEYETDRYEIEPPPPELTKATLLVAALDDGVPFEEVPSLLDAARALVAALDALTGPVASKAETQELRSKLVTQLQSLEPVAQQVAPALAVLTDLGKSTLDQRPDLLAAARAVAEALAALVGDFGQVEVMNRIEDAVDGVIGLELARLAATSPPERLPDLLGAARAVAEALARLAGGPLDVAARRRELETTQLRLRMEAVAQLTDQLKGFPVPQAGMDALLASARHLCTAFDALAGVPELTALQARCDALTRAKPVVEETSGVLEQLDAVLAGTLPPAEVEKAATAGAKHYKRLKTFASVVQVDEHRAALKLRLKQARARRAETEDIDARIGALTTSVATQVASLLEEEAVTLAAEIEKLPDATRGEAEAKLGSQIARLVDELTLPELGRMAPLDEVPDLLAAARAVAVALAKLPGPIVANTKGILESALTPFEDEEDRAEYVTACLEELRTTPAFDGLPDLLDLARDLAEMLSKLVGPWDKESAQVEMKTLVHSHLGVVLARLDAPPTIDTLPNLLDAAQRVADALRDLVDVTALESRISARKELGADHGRAMELLAQLPSGDGSTLEITAMPSLLETARELAEALKKLSGRMDVSAAQAQLQARVTAMMTGLVRDPEAVAGVADLPALLDAAQEVASALRSLAGSCRVQEAVDRLEGDAQEVIADAIDEAIDFLNGTYSDTAPIETVRTWQASCDRFIAQLEPLAGKYQAEDAEFLLEELLELRNDFDARLARLASEREGPGAAASRAMATLSGEVDTTELREIYEALCQITTDSEGTAVLLIPYEQRSGEIRSVIQELVSQLVDDAGFTGGFREGQINAGMFELEKLLSAGTPRKHAGSDSETSDPVADIEEASGGVAKWLQAIAQKAKKRAS